jgi:hypothetical protein
MVVIAGQELGPGPYLLLPFHPAVLLRHQTWEEVSHTAEKLCLTDPRKECAVLQCTLLMGIYVLK